jgi:competence protein ComEC
MQKLESAPAFKIAFLFVTGIIIGAEFRFNIAVIIILIVIQFLYFFYLLKKNPGIPLDFVLLTLLIIFLGILKANIDFYLIPGNSVSGIPDTKRSEEAVIIGVIQDIPSYDTNKIRFTLSSEFFINSTNHDTLLISGDVLVTIKRNPKTDYNDYSVIQSSGNISYDFKPGLSAGDRVLLYGRLSEPFEERNPGEFDYKRYLKLHNIYKTFTAQGFSNAEIINRNNISFLMQKIIYPARKFASGNIDKYIPGDEGAFLKGLVTGERQDISRKVKDDFVKTGIMHVIAVSGLNVAYIILSLTLILALIRVPRIPKVIIIILFLIFYCFFTGYPASIIRATVMGSLILIAGVIQRKTNFYNIIGISVLIILIYDAKQLYDPGFILSFSAVLSMVFFYEKFDEILLKKILDSKFRFKKMLYNLAGIIFVTIAAQIGTLPLTSYYFEKISFISLLANAIIVPLSNLSLATGFFQIASATFSDFISSVIAGANLILLKLQLWTVDFLASFRFGYIGFYRFNTVNTIGYLALLLIFFTTGKKTLKVRLIISSVLILLLVLLNINYKNNLRITYLYAGQGDCTLIESPDGSNILIDCGMKDFRFNSGESTIVPYLKRRGISRIDLLILTHLHYDHIGGIESVLNNFSVKKIISDGAAEENSLTRSMDKLIVENKIPTEKLYSGDYIEGFGKLILFFLNPAPNDSLHTSEHSKSIVVKLKYGNTDAVFIGDLNVEGETYVAGTYGSFLKSNILKVSHHGSKNASSVPFLLKCRPDYAVISCGKDNVFGHPSDLVLAKLEVIGAKVLRTDRDGAVIFESDGKTIERVNWR